MIAVDSNILIHAHRKDSPWHEPAHRAIAELATGKRSWALPWPCVHEFLAVVTHARVFAPPSTTVEALAQVDAWMESPTLMMIGETQGYWKFLSAEIRRSRVAGPQVHDARIAALCKFHRVQELWTADRDFSRFADLRLYNPLLA